MAAVSPQDVHRAFADTDRIDDEDVLEKCAHLCRIYQLSADDLHNKWESFTFAMQSAEGGDGVAAVGEDERGADGSIPLNATWFEKFKQHLQSERGKAFAQQQQHAPASSKTALSSSISSTADPRRLSTQTRGGITNVQTKSTFEGMLNNLLGPKPSQQVGGGSGKVPSATPKPVRKVGAASAAAAFTPAAKGSGYAMSPQGVTPHRGKDGTIGTSSPQAAKFLERDNSGKVELVYNEHLPAVTTPLSSDVRKPRTEIAVYPGFLTEGYRYMYEKLNEKSFAMNEHITTVGQAIAMEHTFIDEVGNPAQTSQESIRTYGRVCSETDARLNDKSLVLETTRQVGNGCRVALNVDKVPAFSMFPGQVVGVTGINIGGRSGFQVSEIFPTPLQEKASTSVSELYNYNYSTGRLNGTPMSLHIAAGPFTLEDSLNFEPFACMMDRAETEAPDILILIGPFIDESHPEIVAGRIPCSFEQLFADKIATRLYSFVRAHPKSQVLLVPSTKDVLHSYQVFPQPPLDKTGLFRELRQAFRKDCPFVDQQIFCLPNPCVFVINEVYFGVSSVDVLFHLTSDEISRIPVNAPKTDRMSRLARHILDQRSFYPLCPPNVADSLVDYTRSAQFDLPLTPDVLILPSRLALFAKPVEGVLVVNPGPLCRKQAGGTFTKMAIHPLSKANFPEHVTQGGAAMKVDGGDGEDVDEDGEQLMYHIVDERTRVEIVRV